MIIAHIIGGVVDNLAVYDSMDVAHELAAALGFTPVDIGKFPVEIGDEYADGAFSRDGVPLVEMPDEIDLLRAEIADADRALAIALGEVDEHDGQQ